MSDLVEDRQLAAGFRAGDTAALAQVYRQYLPLVAGIVTGGFSFESQGRRVRFGGASSAFDCDDLVADVFARAFRPAAREAWDGLRPYGAYLSTITHNVVVDRLRQRVDLLLPAEPAPERERGHDQAGADGDTPDLAFESKELRALVQAYVARLPAREKEIVSRRFGQGQSQAQTALDLGLSRPTLRKLERKLIKGLFRSLRAAGYFEALPEVEPLSAVLACLLALGCMVEHVS